RSSGEGGQTVWPAFLLQGGVARSGRRLLQSSVARRRRRQWQARHSRGIHSTLLRGVRDRSCRLSPRGILQDEGLSAMNSKQFEAAKKFCDTPSGRIAYAEAGQGPVVLFVHGVLVNSYIWRHQLAGLADI